MDFEQILSTISELFHQPNNVNVNGLIFAFGAIFVGAIFQIISYRRNKKLAMQIKQLQEKEKPVKKLTPSEKICYLVRTAINFGPEMWTMQNGNTVHILKEMRCKEPGYEKVSLRFGVHFDSISIFINEENVNNVCLNEKLSNKNDRDIFTIAKNLYKSKKDILENERLNSIVRSLEPNNVYTKTKTVNIQSITGGHLGNEDRTTIVDHTDERFKYPLSDIESLVKPNIKSEIKPPLPVCQAAADCGILLSCSDLKLKNNLFDLLLKILDNKSKISFDGHDINSISIKNSQLSVGFQSYGPNKVEVWVNGIVVTYFLTTHQQATIALMCYEIVNSYKERNRTLEDIISILKVM